MSGAISVGDVVRLKSDGPPMTVADVGPGWHFPVNGDPEAMTPGSVYCQWHDADHRLNGAVFPVASLVIVRLPAGFDGGMIFDEAAGVAVAGLRDGR